MSVRKADINDADRLAPLIARFRVTLLSLKNIAADENIQAAREELAVYVNAGCPVFVYERDGECLGYLVCRVDMPTVWVESLFVLNKHRRQGIASALFNEAEKLAVSYGEDTMYNYVHPNNDNMIAFLDKKGYNTLNLIEIRKKYNGETSREQIRVRNNTFDY